MTFADLFPHIRPWVVNLGNIPPGSFVKPQFAVWEILHILSLVVLGGSAILLNLRLIGAGITDEPPSEVRRNLWPWLNVGAIGIVVTGLLIGTANAERLYDSNAFTVKMAALLAGIVFTYGVSGPIAKAEGSVGAGAKIGFVAGLAVWLFGLWVFATSALINPGVFHLLTAAALVVLFVARGRLRWGYLVGLLALIAAQFVATHVLIKPDDYTALTPVNKAFAAVFAAWIVGAALVQLFRAGDRQPGGPLARLAGYAGILVWVTAAAAGRWIAFA
jgi:hypothetical protein